MNLRVDKVLTDNRYQITLTPENWTLPDIGLMDQFGEPTVEVGGTTALSPAFVFPTEPRLVKSGFPYTRVIDGDDDADAKGKMNNWVAEMQQRFITALATLRGKTDDFTGITVLNI